ncbi:MAG TPA: ABC-type transport auxiliary lipoprotein family protein [Stellaceae bacterium]|nr:ABC-type transport auxiliary lipoprotein family protein [Stellaceae bacterium]
MKLWAILLATLALCSCSGSILPKPAPPPQLYHLTALAPAQNAGPPIELQLAVDEPAAPASLDVDRIALTQSELRLDYFANAAWGDRAPAMIQSLIVASLTDAGRIRVVMRSTGELRPDATLAIDLQRFDAEYHGGGAPEVHVRLVCRLVHDRNAVAVRTFSGTAQAGRNDTADIVAAFDAAMHDVLGALVPWTADELAAMKR